MERPACADQKHRPENGGIPTPLRSNCIPWQSLLFRWVSLRDRCYFNVSLACPLTQNAREPTRWFPSVLCQDCVTYCVINQSDSIQMIMQFTAFGTDDTRHMSWPAAPLIHVNTVSINACIPIPFSHGHSLLNRPIPEPTAKPKQASIKIRNLIVSPQTRNHRWPTRDHHRLP